MYPIYYSVELSVHVTSIMLLQVTIENDLQIYSVLDRMLYFIQDQ